VIELIDGMQEDRPTVSDFCTNDSSALYTQFYRKSSVTTGICNVRGLSASPALAGRGQALGT
jgi:hypothetical protein